ncbi:MAG TPA: twin-arginine translocase TatA/TatE family subunit, partial [Myxococcota bacterium]|nr:twin-arginine translocase TatA/TatE family subunit [Myxococcota bacterium]
MFGLSTWELLIIVAVALIFVGPDQLPKVARTIGKGMRQVRGAMGKVDDEMRKAVREVSAELDDE